MVELQLDGLANFYLKRRQALRNQGAKAKQQI
jgi:hypothetical protein